MVPCERTGTVAVGHGKLAARNIDAWLLGSNYVEPVKAPLVSSGMLRPSVFSEVDPTAQKTLPLAQRVSGFGEVVAGLRGSARAKRATKHSVDCPAATASNVTIASPPVPTRR